MMCPCNCTPRPMVDALNGTQMTSDELATIATDSRNAVAHRDWAIGQAHDHGMSLRTIADAVGLSHMGVKHIVERRDR